MSPLDLVVIVLLGLLMVCVAMLSIGSMVVGAIFFE